jgi:hypothetical protein
MGIETALQIEGWMGEADLQWLWDNAVGSYLGRSTRALVDGDPEMAIAIDDWIGPRDANRPLKDFEGIAKTFIENLHDVLTAGRLEMWYYDHRAVNDISARLANRTPDVVFIDGDHAFENVLRDVLFWRRHLAQGRALLSGHDHGTGYPSVIQAVADAVGPVHVVPGGTIWFVQFEDGNPKY